MKRLILTVVLALACLVASAQPKAFGVRFGSGLEISYQHNLGKNFVEIDAGVLGYTQYPGYRVSAAFDFNLMRTKLFGGDFCMFLGPGLTAGMYGKSQFMAGFAIQYGVSYEFHKIPLSISLDTRPCLTLSDGNLLIPYKELIPMGSLRWKF